jgi:hypothetical protein
MDTQDGLWQRILKDKCLRNKLVALVKTSFSDYPCWKAFLQVNDIIYMVGGGVVLKLAIYFGFGKMYG